MASLIALALVGVGHLVMILRRLSGAPEPEPQRGAISVCLVATHHGPALRRSVQSIVAQAGPSCPVVVVIAGTTSTIEEELSEAVGVDSAGRELLWLDASKEGLVAGVNRVLEQLGPADVVLLTEPCLLPTGALEQLRAAVDADTTTATASALADTGAPLNVRPEASWVPVDGEQPEAYFREQSARVLANSLTLRPRLATICGPCVYVRRAAVELVGVLDPALDFRPALELDFAQRCLLRGLSHVAADDVLVGRLGPTPGTLGLPRLLQSRYPYLDRRPRAAASSVLQRALAAVRRPQSRLSVTIDARALSGPLTGTHVHIMELISAVANSGRLELRIVIPPDLAPGARARLRGLPDTTMLAAANVGSDTRVTDIVHRPHQVFSPEDFDLLIGLGRRVVISQLDMIAYHNPGYFPDGSAWERYKRIARIALAGADRVIVSSEHTVRDLLADELVTNDRVRIVPPGLDHRSSEDGAPPAALKDGDVSAFLLCLGTDFHHKNRLFALALLRELRAAHGWTGRLVLAGTHVPHGSSREAERALLASDAALQAAVTDLGTVSEAEKVWLLSRAAGVVYPSVYEGFGLIPFEAAQAGVPCLFAPQTSLAEVLPTGVATLVPWSVASSAHLAVVLMEDQDARARHVHSIREAASQQTWARTAEALIDVYDEVLIAPTREVLALSRDQLTREREMDRMRAEHAELVDFLRGEVARWGSAYGELREQVGEGLGLIGPRGSLPDELQRALMALSAHPRVSGPLFGAAAAAYRGARRISARRS